MIQLFSKLLINCLSKKETKQKKELKLKLELAKFLQITLDEMSLQAKGETHSAKAKEFADFFNKVIIRLL